ncbi:hypothetical protein ACQP1G_10965 [Nocardia sp. CA-107356]|uniref:hypothetical protein n=1 Tax=Nocardia sp. CA-107356 TaxID=3239972 RepID=UPI003D8D4C3D
MDANVIRRVAGVSGLIAALLMLVELPLYFVYDGAPPDSNVLTRSLFGLTALTLLVVFISGFGYLLKHTAYEWVGTVAATAGLMWLAVAFVGTGLEVGAVIQAPEPIDPTITVSGTYILYGTISRLLEGLFLAASGLAVLRTSVLSHWIGWSAWMLALINVVFVPSLFFGNTPANFYAANGWGTTATVGGFTMLWLLAVGITMAVRRPTAAAGTPVATVQRVS